MEEFVSVSHLAICDDLTLMEAFRIRIVRMVMPKVDYCWTLAQYINFALWIEGASFTVDDVEEYSVPSIQPHVTSVTIPDPEPTPTTDKEPAKAHCRPRDPARASSLVRPGGKA